MFLSASIAADVIAALLTNLTAPRCPQNFIQPERGSWFVYCPIGRAEKQRGGKSAGAGKVTGVVAPFAGYKVWANSDGVF